jgi:ribonuclease HI
MKSMKYKLEYKYRIKNIDPLSLTSNNFLAAEDAIIAGEELEKTGKVFDLEFHDEMGSTWTLKEMKKLTEEIEEEPHDVIVYFDGGHDINSNRAGIGAVIYYKQGKKKFRLRANEVIDEMETNNEAEYAALYFALDLLEELGVTKLPCDIKGDSQVVLKQLEGEWPCYEENLNRWLDRIEEKIKKLGLLPRYEAISRKDNKESDKLATQALEGKSIHSKMQLI